jgi:hypothetical protein
VEADGSVKTAPAITIGNTGRKPEINIYSTAVRLLTGALNVKDNTSIEGELNVKDNAIFEKGIETAGFFHSDSGMLTTHYWGSFAFKTQNDWFEVFKNRIPVGKRLQTNGCGLFDYISVFCFIERIDDNTIEINGMPIAKITYETIAAVVQDSHGENYLSTKNLPILDPFADEFTIIQCKRGNNDVVSKRHYLSW